MVIMYQLVAVLVVMHGISFSIMEDIILLMRLHN